MANCAVCKGEYSPSQLPGEVQSELIVPLQGERESIH